MAVATQENRWPLRAAAESRLMKLRSAAILLYPAPVAWHSAESTGPEFLLYILWYE